MAKPFKKIDPELVRKLSAIHCTTAEIARACDCSNDTLERRFMDIMEAGRAEGKASLRRLQWQTAQKGNPAMQIWLGKQLLGQRDYKTTLEDATDEQLAAEIHRRMKNAPGGT